MVITVFNFLTFPSPSGSLWCYSQHHCPKDSVGKMATASRLANVQSKKHIYESQFDLITLISLPLKGSLKNKFVLISRQ